MRTNHLLRHVLRLPCFIKYPDKMTLFGSAKPDPLRACCCCCCCCCRGGDESGCCWVVVGGPPKVVGATNPDGENVGYSEPGSCASSSSELETNPPPVPPGGGGGGTTRDDDPVAVEADLSRIEGEGAAAAPPSFVTPEDETDRPAGEVSLLWLIALCRPLDGAVVVGGKGPVVPVVAVPNPYPTPIPIPNAPVPSRSSCSSLASSPVGECSPNPVRW